MEHRQDAVGLLAPHYGKVYHRCCGSGGRLVQSEEFIEAHGGKIGDVAIFGQEANPTTSRPAAMNLALRGIDFNLGREPAETFMRDPFLDLRADFILANPPFNISDSWHTSLGGDAREVYGDPPQRNANYAWLQHMLQQLKPGGRAGDFVSRSSIWAVQSWLHDLRGESNCSVGESQLQLGFLAGVPVLPSPALPTGRMNFQVQATRVRDAHAGPIFVAGRPFAEHFCQRHVGDLFEVGCKSCEQSPK